MPHVAAGGDDDDGSGGSVAREEEEEEEEEEEGAAPVLLQALARSAHDAAAPPADAYEDDEEDGGLDGQQRQLRRAVSGAHFAYGGGDEEEDDDEDGDKKRSGGAFGLGRKPERPVDVGCFVFPLGETMPEVRAAQSGARARPGRVQWRHPGGGGSTVQSTRRPRCAARATRPLSFYRPVRTHAPHTPSLARRAPLRRRLWALRWMCWLRCALAALVRTTTRPRWRPARTTWT
jgi:hypothetical protein